MSSSSSSLIPANPCFRNAAVNTVVVVPLLINNNSNQGENEDPTTTATTTTTRSAQSFDHLMEALRRYASKKHAESTTAELAAASSSSSSSDTKNTATPRPAQDSSSSLVLVVPNSNLTRPGDWKYPDTPLKSFHWQHGCQRLRIVVPNYNNKSQQQPTAVVDDEKNDKKDDSDAWIDLCPGRRTAAVVGVLNLHDCRSAADLHRACGELHTLATVRYATCGGGNNNKPAGDPPTPRDLPVVRLFLYDSFDQESQQFDLSSQMVPETSILAFPPVVLDDEEQMMMMDLHLNLVVSDLTVAIFRDLEDKIQESLCMVDSDYSLQQQQQQQQSSMQQQQQQGGLARRSLTRFVTGSGGSSGDGTGATQSEEPTKSARNLGISQLASLVNPESKLAKDSPTNTRGSTAAAGSNSSFAETFIQTTPIGSSKLPSKLPPLLTPLDVDADDSGGMSSSAAIKGPKDIDVMRKLDTGRREKYIADLCLLAGSPLDAYEHYLKAAELCKTVSMDPLWHASALEGCAAAHIAMAEAGGYR